MFRVYGETVFYVVVIIHHLVGVRDNNHPHSRAGCGYFEVLVNGGRIGHVCYLCTC